jgi:hypothetical protein
MASGREAAMRVASVHLGPFVFGPNTLWLGILMFAAFLIGAIFFTKNPDVKTVRGLKISAACSERCC